MKTSLSENGALKLLLLLTSLSHYSVHMSVTSAGTIQDICASIAANNPVNFFLVGRHSSNRLLITAKPDYLVYELPPDSLQNDTVNISDVKPVPLENYFPVLYQNETFQKLIYGKNESQVKIFSSGSLFNSDTYLRMVSMDNKLLFTYNMDSNDTDVNPNITVPSPVQEFVSASDAQHLNSSFYSFCSIPNSESLRLKYNLDSRKDMSISQKAYTCETAEGNLALRSHTLVFSKEKNCQYRGLDFPNYSSWNWVESFKGWTENLIEKNRTVRFYLFDKTNQQVMIFDQFDVHFVKNDFISAVSYKKYKDFFVCPEPKVTTLTLSTTSAHSNTTSNVTEVFNRTTLVYNSSSTHAVETSSEMSKFPLWIIILIVVIILVVIIVSASAWYYYGGKKSQDTKSNNKAASKVVMSNVKSTVSGGKASSVVTSKILSTKVISSKVASSSNVQSKSKQLVGANRPRDATKVKASSSADQTKVGTNLVGPKVSPTKQLVVGQSKVGVGGKTGCKDRGKTSGISPAGTKLNANSSAASKASIRSSIAAPSKAPGFKAKK